MSAKAAPQPTAPPPDWAHVELHRRVQAALLALPAHFRPELRIAGILATDIFALNSSLGATIEAAVVEGLNYMRPVWDPDRTYDDAAFVRQSQRFPDVLLTRNERDGHRVPLFGIELKGWYLLAKEGEPSFRMQVTPDACAPGDLLVVFPWALSHVISGAPELYPPFIVPARYAAEYRNHHWARMRTERGANPGIKAPATVQPYPSKSAQINDAPESDKGGNFGRIARTGMLDEYIARIDDELLAGIPARHWRSFFKVFEDGADAPSVGSRIEQLLERLPKRIGLDEPRVARIRDLLGELAALLDG